MNKYLTFALFTIFVTILSYVFEYLFKKIKSRMTGGLNIEWEKEKPQKKS